MQELKFIFSSVLKDLRLPPSREMQRIDTLAARAAHDAAAKLEAAIRTGCALCGVCLVEHRDGVDCAVDGTVIIEWPDGTRYPVCGPCCRKQYGYITLSGDQPMSEITATNTVHTPEWLDAKITVCDKCLQASCWQGLFYCNDYRTAGVRQMARRELLELKLENPDYWKTDEEFANTPVGRFSEKVDWKPLLAPTPHNGGSAHGELLYEAHRALMPSSGRRPPYRELDPTAQGFWAAVAERYHAGLRGHGVT